MARHPDWWPGHPAGAFEAKAKHRSADRQRALVHGNAIIVVGNFVLT